MKLGFFQLLFLTLLILKLCGIIVLSWAWLILILLLPYVHIAVAGLFGLWITRKFLKKIKEKKNV